jgi:Cof subfamily protein (haloacid dehalogenase superfamily)
MERSRVRLLATDLDGTLLRDDLTLSLRTREALRRARSMGVPSVPVTARPPRRVRALSERVGLSGQVICANGALIYDLDRDAVVRQARLAAKATHALIAALRESAPGVAFAIEAGIEFGSEERYAIPVEHTEDHGTGRRAVDASELCDGGVTKLIVQHLELPFEQLLSLVTRCAGIGAQVTHSGSEFVEVSAAGVTKAAALAEYCRERGIDAREVVAVGDMPNDLPMLQWAGWSVAVANAHPDVLQACDAHTTNNNEDGVAELLEKLAANAYVMPRTSR